MEQVLPGAEGKRAGKAEADSVGGKNIKVAVKKIFCEMKVGLNKALDKAMEESVAEMDQMTTEQQEQVVLFWDQMGDLIKNLLEWVDRIFDKIVDNVKEGHNIDRNATAKLFKSVSAALEESINTP